MAKKNTEKFIRCRVNTSLNDCDMPKKANALLLVSEPIGGRVLIDGEEEARLYNWGWIKFEKGVKPE